MLKNTETGPRPSQVKFRQASIHQLKDVAGLPGVLHHGDGPPWITGTMRFFIAMAMDTNHQAEKTM